jgi:hypothetical protein
MNSFVTTYNGLFGQHLLDMPAVERIEIPLIQRDYAQGRAGKAVARIRGDFLDVLRRAVTGGEPVSLDFVYGDVVEGTLRPLDGQQRLTTLFLLHWYLASRAGRLDEEQGWKRLTYATRASARLFCERLVCCQPPSELLDLSAWIEDQPWFLHTWCHDPTIQSMLLMLDAMHQCFAQDDCVAAWERLIDRDRPAISFHLLPMSEMGLDEDLYIKMNSRGKPLTPFENFKARFEQVLEKSCPDCVAEFARRVDGEWSDTLWPYRGGDSIVDDEFLRYFEFITELCEWREGRLANGEIGTLAERVFGSANPAAAAQLDFLFQAFDTWVGQDIPALFDRLFAKAAPGEGDDHSRVVLFGSEGDGVETDLFAVCCREYGKRAGSRRVFSLAHTLLLYAVILHRIHGTEDFPRRLRVLRNLLEASVNELREARMPALVADVARIVVDGSLDGVTAFNQAQVADERLKTSLLARHPHLTGALYRLEDQPVLRGCVAAFELDADTFRHQAHAFCRLMADPDMWPALTGALLAIGDYSRHLPSGRAFQFGSMSSPSAWRKLLTDVGRSQLAATRQTFGQLLDRVAEAGDDLEALLATLQQQWIKSCDEANRFDWRYYFVKYPVMRKGQSGIYVGMNGELRYSVCMLQRTQMNSWYRDPYLLAMHRESGVGSAVEDPWFTGYESQPRWMQLKKSGVEFRCVDEGIEIRHGRVDEADALRRILERHGTIVKNNRLLRAVPKVPSDDKDVDAQDRVQIGAALLRELVAVGF